MLDKRWVQALLAGILGVQMLVLRISYGFHRLTARHDQPHGYVVGMEEIAGLLTAMSRSLDDVVTVSLTSNPLYDHRYDVEFDLRGRWPLYKRVRRTGRRALGAGSPCGATPNLHLPRRRGVSLRPSTVAIGSLGFLRNRGRIVVCYFTGSDIRSQPLMNEFGRDIRRDVVTTYEPLVSPGIASETADRHRRALVASAERHAQLIFNATVEQMSYFERPTEPALYFFPDEHITRRPQKWWDLSRPVIVHAPTSPVIKGTPLVHAASRLSRSRGTTSTTSN